MLTQEQKETIRLHQIDERLKRLSKIIDLSQGRNMGLQVMYDEFMNERDELIRGRMKRNLV